MARPLLSDSEATGGGVGGEWGATFTMLCGTRLDHHSPASSPVHAQLGSGLALVSGHPYGK